MTLIDMLTAISFVLPIALFASIGWNKGGPVGRLIGLAAGLVIGSVMGLVNFRAVRVVGPWAFSHLPEEETLLSFALGLLSYLGFMAWIVGSSFVVARFAEFLLQAFAAMA